MSTCVRRVMSVVLLFVVAVPVITAGQSSAPATMPVSILATVLSKFGLGVFDLTKDDFEVLDNGKRQPVTVFENKKQPIALVVLVDRSGTLGWDPVMVWSAAERLVSSCVLPGDTARVGTFSSKIILSPSAFTGDHDALVKAFAESSQGAGPAPLWNAASEAIDALAAQPARRVLLLVSQNRDAPDKPGGATMADVRARAQANNVVVYGIGLAPQTSRGAIAPMSQSQQGRGRGSSDTDPSTKALSAAVGMPDPGLKILATETGGDYYDFESGISVPASFEYIANELHFQYLLGFSAPTLDGKTHALDVKVKRSGLVVNARKSYVASSRDAGK